MATFNYIARQPDGSKLNGRMQAESESAVARSLDEQGLFPVRIEQLAGRAGSAFSRARSAVRQRDIGVFYGQLGDLLDSGVPLMRSLNILGKVGFAPALASLIAEVREDVSAGETLAEAMGKRPESFLPLHTAVITAGERAGFLEEALASLADLVDRQDDLKSKVRGALMYPSVLVGVGIVIITVMLIFLVPRFKGMFGAMDLPVPTRMLFAASDLLRSHLGLMLGLGLLAGIGLRAFVRSESGANAWQRWQLKLPMVGNVIKMLSITRFCRVLGAMLANGVPILEALGISRDAVGSRLIAARIDAAAEAVRQGKSLAEPLADDGLFPPEIVEMIAVGEESNQLERVLTKTADTFERRTNRKVDQAVRLIEPLILVALACAVGFIAVGILYPIMNMSETLQ